MKDPADLGTLQELCNLFDRVLSMDRTEEAAEDVVSCRSTFLEMLEGSISEYGEDALELAALSADRILALSRGERERLEAAEKGFALALRDTARCDGQAPLLPFGAETAASCVRARAKLTSVLRQLGRVEAEVPGVVWRGPGEGALPHLQLPGIRAQPTWDPAELPWLTSIGAELRAVVQAEWPTVATHRSTTQTFIAKSKGDWSSHTMFIGDSWDEDLCRLCPRTCALLRPLRELNPANARLPDSSVKPVELLATFHSLRPGGKILPHFGSHGRLVVSVGVDGLEGAEIRVGESTLRWSKDNFIVFDDAFDHEVTNHGSSSRVVFSLCVLHPDVVVPL